jgi:hypothetical protein
MWSMLLPVHSGIALIRQGRFAEGTASLEGRLVALEEGGGCVMFPCWKSALAEGMAQLGDLESALHLIDEIIAQSSGRAGKSVVTMPKRCASRVGCSRSRAT